MEEVEMNVGATTASNTGTEDKGGGENIIESVSKIKCDKQANRLFLGLNKYVILCILLVYCLVSGPSYFNWTPVADMLYMDGAYEWECTKQEIADAISNGAKSYEKKCTKQEYAVNELFSIGSATQFPLSLVGGLLLDKIGPKVTGCFGVGSMIIGWILLAFAGQAAPSLYKAGCVMMAGAIDISFFPCLCFANLFQNRSSTVIALLGTFRSLSFVDPVILRSIVVTGGVVSFRTAVLVFAGFGLGLCMFVAFLVFPLKAYPRLQAEEAKAGKLESCEITQNIGLSVDEIEAQPPQAVSQSSNIRLMKSILEDKRFSVLKEMASPLYLLLIPFFVFILYNVVFFIPSAHTLLPNAYTAHQYIQIFSFLPCTPLGILADMIGIVSVMQICNIFGLLSYILVLIPGIPAFTAFQYLSSILLALQTSFLLSQLYCYGALHFSEENIGTMIGIVGAVAGVFSLFTNLARQSALTYGYGPICGVSIGLGCINVIILFIISFLQRRKQNK